ncbi:MAG: pseudouridine synthase [bacterium]
MIQTSIYTNEDFSLVRKPAMIPSTFGKEKSFLDILKNAPQKFQSAPLPSLLEKKFDDIPPFLLDSLQEEKDIHKRANVQVDKFRQEQEYGLLNRLDNNTTGFLYFAKTQEFYTSFKQLQKEEKITKYYLTQVYGDLSKDKKLFSNEEQTADKAQISISFSVMHHQSIPEKMLVIKNPQDIRLGRGKQHEVKTNIEIVHYDKENNISTLLVTIQRGIRHQIRAHLASIGYPIV